jgi:hypothetical protein
MNEDYMLGKNLSKKIVNYQRYAWKNMISVYLLC